MKLIWKWRFIALAALIAACDDPGTTPRPSGGITLSWLAPSEYDDGSALSLSELNEYRVYVDRELAGIVDPHLTNYFVELSPGDWEISMSAVAAGVESLPSNPMLVHIPGIKDQCTAERRRLCGADDLPGSSDIVR